MVLGLQPKPEVSRLEFQEGVWPQHVLGSKPNPLCVLVMTTRWHPIQAELETGVNVFLTLELQIFCSETQRTRTLKLTLDRRAEREGENTFIGNCFHSCHAYFC